MPSLPLYVLRRQVGWHQAWVRQTDAGDRYTHLLQHAQTWSQLTLVTKAKQRDETIADVHDCFLVKTLGDLS